MAAVWTDIITTLRTKIDAMTTGGGYNFDYDNVDEYRPASKTYPNVQIIFPEELARDPDDNVVNAYSTDIVITLRCTVDNTTTPTDTALDNVLEDMKRLLEAETTTLCNQGVLIGDYTESTREYTHVRARPGIINIMFNFFYRLQRTDPSLTT